MAGYTDIIVEAVGCSPADAAEIEDMMRHVIFHSTLDWQDRETLHKGARDAVDVLRARGDKIVTTKTW